MKTHARSRGQALVMIALCTLAMFGAVGLVVDIGWAYFRTEVIRSGAEAAALAAATQAISVGTSGFNCNSSGLTCASSDTACSSSPSGTSTATSACLYASQNGFANSGSGNVRQNAGTISDQNVTFTCGTSQQPPTVPGACVDYWFTVRIREKERQMFSSVMGHPFLTTSRRATAAVIGSGVKGGCLYVLNPNASKALMVNGGTDLEVPCGIWVNSNASDAIFQTSGATVNASPGPINVVGGVKQTGHAVMTPNPTTITPFSDPLADMPLPTYSSGCTYTNLKLTHSTTLNPGTYCGGISIAGNDNDPVVFNPGLYVILGGGITMTGGTGATGSGVTFYLTGNGSYAYQGIDIHGNGTYTFTAPTSGTYESMLFIKDRTQPAGGGSTMTGATTMTAVGIIYLPNESLTFAGNPAASAYTVIVCDTFKNAGISYVNNSYTSLNGCVPGFRQVALIE